MASFADNCRARCASTGARKDSLARLRCRLRVPKLPTDAATIRGWAPRCPSFRLEAAARPLFALWLLRSRARGGFGGVQCHGGADERFERLLIDLVALMEIDGAPRVAFEAGVEEL